MNKLRSVLSVLDFLNNEELNEVISKSTQYEIIQKDNLLITIQLQVGLRLSIIQKINKFNQKQTKFKIECKISLDLLDITALNLYISDFLKQTNTTFLTKSWVYTDIAVEANDLIIKYHNNLQLKEWTDIKNNLINYFNNVLNISVNDIQLVYDEDLQKHHENIINQEKKFFEEYENQLKNNVQEKKKTSYFHKANFSDEITPIKDLFTNDKNKLIQGEVFNVKETKFRNGTFLYSYYVTDKENSILVKQYFKNPTDNQIKVGDHVKMIIDVETSISDSREYLCGKLKKVQILEKEILEIEDDLDHHRIEMSLHSKMSTYDGLIVLDELKNKLKQLKHTHFAITDRYNVQNYPNVAKTFKNSGITPIYGVELEKIDAIINGVLNPIDSLISNVEYLIFDLETTGLYPEFDDIIEFGGVVLKNGHIIDRKQFFIKPTVKLSQKITDITNITEQDLVNAIDQENGLKEIIKYCKNRVLIAHNGINFDFSFLNTKLSQYNLPILTNCMIDSMVVSRSINSDFQYHSLEMITKKFKIGYDLNKAHRADYDAELLSKVWMIFINKLIELGCNNLNQINEFIQKPKLRQSTRGDFVVVYAKNQEGIKNIYELVSNSHSKGFYGRPTVTWEEIQKFRNNLIVTNLCIESDVINTALTKPEKDLEKEISKYDFISVCGPHGFYHEIINENISKFNYQLTIKKIINIANKLNIPVVATSNAYYLEEWDKRFHDLYVKMPTLNKKPHRFFKMKTGPITFLHNTHEMDREFAFLDNQELIDKINFININEIIKSIDPNITPLQNKLYPPKIEGVDETMRNKVFENTHKIYGNVLPKIVEDRLNKELDSIINHGYAVVYWVSYLLVNESINDGYVVGSRGSVGSSLVATMLNITDVNPLIPHYLCKHCTYSNFEHGQDVEDGYDLPPIDCPKCGHLMEGEGHNILFEVFLGFYGDKVPDIDLNFSGNYQLKAHNFIKKMFGEQYTYRAGTISTIAEKTSYANTRNYFETIGKEINPAEIERYTTKCVDVKRTTGQHPGGIIVVPKEMSIFDFTPFNYPADDADQEWFTTHFAFEHIHDNLLKFDILGHDNPTILRMLKDLTGVDEKTIPHYNLPTLDLFNSTNELNMINDYQLNEKTGAISIPEFGTKFVREMLIDTKPKSFADLIRISGLSHGTDVWLDNAKNLIQQNGMKLNQIIACRDDIMSYLIQHNVEPKIAFNVMESVRKGKKIPNEYLQTLIDNNVPQWYIDSCNKIKYMFPKAHATAYVMHAWKFAWYKLNYPLEYYASYFSIRISVFNVKVMCSDADTIKAHYDDINTRLKTHKEVTTKEKDLLPLYEIALEMIARGYKFKMIDIYKSDAFNFIVNKDNKELICPFSVLDGLGESVASSIIEARKNNIFTSKEDFIQRTKVSKQHIELMNNLGILDDLQDTDQISLFDI